MSSFKCQYCGVNFPLIDDTYKRTILSFAFLGTNSTVSHSNRYEYHDRYAYCFHFYRCPNCSEITVKAEGLGQKTNKVVIPLSPNSEAKILPDYVPQVIISDYQEACAIVHLSPKASATLARRCLQGMIHDYWHIDKGNLAREIEAIKDKVTPAQWSAIDATRRIGNIGAHMESDTSLIIDIEPEEALLLIKLIELLIEKWYVSRHDEESLLEDIVNINDEKQQHRQLQTLGQ